MTFVTSSSIFFFIHYDKTEKNMAVFVIQCWFFLFFVLNYKVNYRVAQWESNPIPYGRVLVLNSFDAFGWSPGPNLMTRLPVTFESNKGRCSD